MALAERWLAARYNRPGHTVIDHRTYVICSDGDLMEGVSHEAAELAGHQRLGKLVWIFDDNEVTIEGDTKLASSTDQLARFESYGWHVERVADGNDLPLLDGRAPEGARRERTALAHRAPDHDRVGQPEQGGERGRTRRPARDG